jgi:hypothetical protein
MAAFFIPGGFLTTSQAYNSASGKDQLRPSTAIIYPAFGPESRGVHVKRAGILTHPTTEGLPGKPVAQSSGLFGDLQQRALFRLGSGFPFHPSNQSDRWATCLTSEK